MGADDTPAVSSESQQLNISTECDSVASPPPSQRYTAVSRPSAAVSMSAAADGASLDTKARRGPLKTLKRRRAGAESQPAAPLTAHSSRDSTLEAGLTRRKTQDRTLLGHVGNVSHSSCLCSASQTFLLKTLIPCEEDRIWHVRNPSASLPHFISPPPPGLFQVLM